MRQVEFLAVLVLVALGVAFMLLLGSRRSRRRESAPWGEEEFDPADLAEISSNLAAIAAEREQDPQDRAMLTLKARLHHVITRRCPIRAIAPAPVAGAARICFADGTRVLVRSQRGRIARLAYEAAHYPICLRSCRSGPEGPELTFDCIGGQFVAVAVGLDQAD